MKLSKKSIIRMASLARTLVPLCAPFFLSGCVQTLAQAYLDPSDACFAVRKPIVDAGDALDQRQRAMADAYGRQMMQGRERPVVVSNGRKIQFSLGNALANAAEEAGYAQQAYMQLKAQEGGQNAAAQLASIQGDVANDGAQFRLVSRTIRNLRDCRRGQAALTQAAVRNQTMTTADAALSLDKQRIAAIKDDELVGKVFRQYGQRATMYAEAERTIDPSGGVRVAAARSSPRANSRRAPVQQVTSVASLEREQAEVQATDRRDSTEVKNAIEAVRVGLQQRSELLRPMPSPDASALLRA